MKNILFVGYDYNEGGVGVFLKKLSDYIAQNGYDCQFLVSNKDVSSKKSNIYQISNCSKDEVYKIIDRSDIVHVAGHNFEHLKIMWLAYLRKKFIVCNYHNYFYNKTSFFKRLELFVKKFLIINFCELLSDNVVYLSEAQKINFSKFSFYSQKRSEVIQNFIESHNILNKKENIFLKKIIFVGRPTKEKGFPDVLQISKEIDIPVYVVGSNALYPEDPIISLGKVRNEDIYKIYDECQILFLPSGIEVFPMTVLEAMARGLVVLMYDIPGINEIIVDKRNGFLVSPGELNTVKEIIAHLRSHPEDIQKISQNNILDVQKFTVETQASKYFNIYKRAELKVKL
jgi:glycosyltransferase involved in cell wall biosynthesis